MNIGLFTDTYYPELNGVANSVYLLKKELEKRGHNVYVITTKTPPGGSRAGGAPLRPPARGHERAPRGDRLQPE